MKIKLSAFPLLQVLTLIASLSCYIPIQADNLIWTVDQLIKSPSLPPPNVKFLGFKPKANPDANTCVCDSELNKQLLETSGKLGEQFTRTLYVRGTASIDLDIAFKRGEAILLPARIAVN